MKIEEIKKQLRSTFSDGYGLICQKDRNFGDSTQRCGMVYLAYKILGENYDHMGTHSAGGFNIALQMYESKRPGYYRRYYKDGPRCGTERQPGEQDYHCWSHTNVWSRDQQTSLVIAMGEYEQHEKLKQLLLEHLKRGGKYQNKDFILPIDAAWGAYVRGLRAYLFYPYLLLSDLGLVIGSTVAWYKSKYHPRDVSDYLNQAMLLLQAVRTMPTPLSYIARKIFARAQVQRGFDLYFHPSTDAPPIDHLYRPIIKEYFGG